MDTYAKRGAKQQQREQTAILVMLVFLFLIFVFRFGAEFISVKLNESQVNEQQQPCPKLIASTLAAIVP